MARLYSHLPDVVKFRGREYTFHQPAEALELRKEHVLNKELERLKKCGYLTRVVRVLSPKLKDRTDLHGQPYQPSVFIFKHFAFNYHASELNKIDTQVPYGTRIKIRNDKAETKWMTIDESLATALVSWLNREYSL